MEPGNSEFVCFEFLRDFPAKLVADLPKVRSGRVCDREGNSSVGVKYGDAAGVKEQAPDAEVTPEEPVVPSVTVFDVADNGMGNASQVPPDLMSSTRQGMYFHQGIPACRVS